MDVGVRLQTIRKLKGLSQRELAKRAGVTNSTISMIEKNSVSPSISSLKKVLSARERIQLQVALHRMQRRMKEAIHQRREGKQEDNDDTIIHERPPSAPEKQNRGPSRPNADHHR